MERNEGWVSVGIDHDTAEFAVASIHRWWTRLGRASYPDAEEVLIIADSGGEQQCRLPASGNGSYSGSPMPPA